MNSAVLKEFEKVILIQGAVLNKGNTALFAERLKKIIRIHTGKIVVSTWEIGESIQIILQNQFPQVTFAFNPDPGAVVKEEKGIIYRSNVNRLIISTLLGLQHIPENSVVLKLRSDSYIKDLSAFSKFESIVKEKPQRDSAYSFTEEFILGCNLFVRNPRAHLPFLYHMGDICFVGLKQDIEKLFSIELADAKTLFKRCRTLQNTTYLRYAPEQYILVNALKKSGKNVDFDGNFDASESQKIDSDKYLINNFVFLSKAQMKFVWPKYTWVYFNKGWSSIYNYNDWKRLRLKYYQLPYTYNVPQYYFKLGIIFFMKGYFVVRTTLLSSTLLTKCAMKLFANRR